MFFAYFGSSSLPIGILPCTIPRDSVSSLSQRNVSLAWRFFSESYDLLLLCLLQVLVPALFLLEYLRVLYLEVV